MVYLICFAGFALEALGILLILRILKAQKHDSTIADEGTPFTNVIIESSKH